MLPQRPRSVIPIRLQQITKKFGETVALDGIDLRIEAGEIFFLLGPSGCGKTTLLRTIAGFYAPESGRIFFGDEDVTDAPPHRRNTGMMFQSYALWPHMTVAQNVAFGLEERRVATPEIARRVEEALASVQMARYGGRRIHQLSGGQLQRVALARAMVIRPRYLLLDEPLSNLDAKLRIEMRTEIRRICRDAGLTAVYVTHDQKEALSIADRMAVLQGGRLRQVGAPGELYRAPVSRFVADFMGETNFIEGKVSGSEGTRTTVDTALGTFQAEGTNGGRQAGAAVTLSIRPESWRLHETAPAGAPNVVEGNLHERLYLGDLAQYRLATRAGTEIKIVEANPRFVTWSGERDLAASVAPEEIVILDS